MDSISIETIVGSVISVSDVVSRSIRRLKELKTTYRDIPHEAAMLTGQLVTVQAALDQLSYWTNKDLSRNPRYQQLATQIDVSLECFGPLMVSLKQSLDEIDCQGVVGISSKKILSFMWHEQGMDNYLSLIDRQVNALNLFLQAVRCRSWEEQKRMIEDDDNQSILQQARECSSSIIVISDSVSIHSEYSGHSRISTSSIKSAAVSIEFGFDALVAASKPYLAAHRAHLRRAIRRRATSDPDNNVSTSSPLATNDGDCVKSGRQTNSVGRLTTSPQISSPEATVSGTRPTEDSVIECASQNHDHPDMIRRTILTPRPREPEGDSTQDKTVRLRILKNWHDSDAPSSKNSTLLYKTLLSKRRSASPTTDSVFRGKAMVRTVVDKASEAKSAEPLSVILLGIAESGKTTLSKAMRLHCNQVDNIQTRHSYAAIIRDNVVTGTRIVLDAMETHGIEFENSLNNRHVQAIPSDHSAVWSRERRAAPDQIATAVSSLWKDRGFLEAYQRRSESSLAECARAFANDIERLMADGYVPSAEDLLRIRVKTLGISPTNLNLSTTDLRLWDTGGERSERKKWMKCPATSAIVFTLDVTACGRHHLQETEGHRMHEQLLVFESIMNSDFFGQELVIVVLTKIDLLEEILLTESRLDEWDEAFKPLVKSTTPMNQAEMRDFFLSQLEVRLRSLVQDEQRRTNVKFVQADLVHPGVDNSVVEILQLLEDFNKAPASIWRQSI